MNGKPESASSSFAWGILRNYAINDSATGTTLVIVQAPSIEVAQARIFIARKATPGGFPESVTLVEHQGPVHSLWLGDAFFLSIPDFKG